jgi:hypothetical protein
MQEFHTGRSGNIVEATVTVSESQEARGKESRKGCKTEVTTITTIAIGGHSTFYFYYHCYMDTCERHYSGSRLISQLKLLSSS